MDKGVLAAIAALLLQAPGLATPDAAAPPLTGDWIITSHERIEDQDVTITGNVVVQRGGVLELLRSNLILATPPPLEARVTIEDGGRVYLNGTSDRPSTIQDTPLDVEPAGNQNWDFFWRIHIQTGGLLEGTHCGLYEVGVHGQKRTLEAVLDAPPYGFLIQGNVNLTHCQITFGGHADDWLYMESGSLTLNHTSFHNEANIYGGRLNVRNSAARFHISGVEAASFFNHFGTIDVVPDDGANPLHVVVDGFTVDTDQPGDWMAILDEGTVVHMKDVAIRMCCSEAGVGAATWILENGFRRGDRTSGNPRGTLNAGGGGHLILINMTVTDNTATDVWADDSSIVDVINSTVDATGGPGLFRYFGLVEVRVVDLGGQPLAGVDVTAVGIAELKAKTNSAGIAILHLPYEERRETTLTSFPRTWTIQIPGDEATIQNHLGSQQVDLVLSGQDEKGADAAFFVFALAALALALLVGKR